MPAASAAMGGGADTGSGFLGIAKKFCLTGASSMAAEGATFPIDITKPRLQLQGQADFTGTKFGFGGMMANIYKTEGLGGLYAGVTPAVARHIPYTGFRAIGYEYIRAFFCGDKPKDQAPLLAKMAAGMSAGGIGQAIAVPCDLIKVRMQGDGRLVAAGKLDKPRCAPAPSRRPLPVSRALSVPRVSGACSFPHPLVSSTLCRRRHGARRRGRPPRPPSRPAPPRPRSHRSLRLPAGTPASSTLSPRSRRPRA